jgi:hypothetical protein
MQQLVLIGQSHRLEVDLHLADDRVPVALRTGDVVAQDRNVVAQHPTIRCCASSSASSRWSCE